VAHLENERRQHGLQRVQPGGADAQRARTIWKFPSVFSELVIPVKVTIESEGGHVVEG
jgi:hypothetical protein